MNNSRDIIPDGGPKEYLLGSNWFRPLWESINGAGSWDANPWVWGADVPPSYPMKTLDLIGQRFGSLVVAERAEMRGGESYWRCACDCGRSVVVRGRNLKSKNTGSCGCVQKKRSASASRVHSACIGRKTSPEYRSWQSMIARCENPNYHHFHRYGGRGIRVCASWRKSFPVFLADMGRRPSGTTLDRIDNDGSYEPGNCRWASRLVQRHNQSRVVAS